jgi:hypothetical protein
MAHSRIHIQPCAVGYEYRLGDSDVIHVARRDDLRSPLFDHVHILHLMLAGYAPYNAVQEERLIRRVVSLTPPETDAMRPGASRNDGHCQEPVCTYCPEPGEDEEWTVEYEVERVQTSTTHAPPWASRTGFPAVPIVVEVRGPDGKAVPGAEWAPHVNGVYTAAQNDLRRVREPVRRAFSRPWSASSPSNPHPALSSDA